MEEQEAEDFATELVRATEDSDWQVRAAEVCSEGPLGPLVIQASRRADGCCGGGSLPDRIEMKMMLSTPSTISRKVSVARAMSVSADNQFIQCLEAGSMR